MIHYSTVPMEVVFQNYDQLEKQELKELQFGHMTMLVEPTGPFEGKIVRMISPVPQDYLNPQLAPGQPITFQPDWAR